MIQEIAAAFAAAKSATELLTLLRQMDASTAVTEKAIELQTNIINLQSEILSVQVQSHQLLADKKELEQRLVEIENWTAQAKEYELAEIDPRVFVFMEKTRKHTTASAPWFCTNCFQNRQTSILQFKEQLSNGGALYSCPACKLVIESVFDHL